MLTLAVIQQKGESGKATLAINLAAAAHLEGRRTLVVDMGRQASAFDWGAARKDGSELECLAVVKADRALPLPRFKEIARGYAGGCPGARLAGCRRRLPRAAWLQADPPRLRPQPRGHDTKLAREAEEELRKSGGELAGVVHQRIAVPDAFSQGESVLTTRAMELAADDIKRL
jgi:cellulose biosynthesis protein BcsQ